MQAGLLGRSRFFFLSRGGGGVLLVGRRREGFLDGAPVGFSHLGAGETRILALSPGLPERAARTEEVERNRDAIHRD